MKPTRFAPLALLLIVALLLVTACATGNVAEADDGAGFLRGLAHGLLAPITFVISLFNDDVAMYEVRNNGGFYNLGFLLGLGCWHGGGRAAYNRGWRRGRREGKRDAVARAW